ncbi:carbohydrate-binding module family 50 protein [Sporormia fimetaria CBS 119925]|uniref:Carbohydrate-binding module family 50 protein n=1 Tax=Sporormia fimetaria CBS 119925 TaxID=1340428 RepID=A0A6A6VE14_9PLEO|nr:carbohydrate-binding module family 50 protein [Sporormia fimetaria CBS 119925]
MVGTSFFLAASSIVSLALGAPIARRQAKAKNYQIFGGNGSMMQGWPRASQWVGKPNDIESLWALNEPIIAVSCKQFGAENPNQTERDQIKAALVKVGQETGIDARFLLAVMMQESKGCPRAPTTVYEHANPGLMQSFKGQASCNSNGNMQNPCPQSVIENMIREGSGKGLDFGLLQALGQAGSNDDSKYYKAARIYNSGHVSASGNLGDGVATHCYASDIANRLVGWPSDDRHPSSCDEVAIMGAAGSASAYAGEENNGGGQVPDTPTVVQPPVESPVEEPVEEPVKQPVEEPVEEAEEAEEPVESPVQNTRPNEANVGNNNNEQNAPANPPPFPHGPTTNEPSAPKIAGAAANCKSWYTVQPGDNCSNIIAPFEVLRRLNPSLDANCSNLWLGYAYCVAA